LGSTPLANGQRITRSPRKNSSALIDDLWRDVRFSLRTMMRRRAATAITLLTIALGIGATSSMALLFGVVGIYGVVSYTVSQRSREVGTRIGVGAAKRDVTALFLRHGLVLACDGLAQKGVTCEFVFNGAIATITDPAGVWIEINSGLENR
jgi:hypothetical protein